MAGALRLVLGDQLSRGLAGLADLDPAKDVVLMAEVVEEARVAPARASYPSRAPRATARR